MYNLEFLRLTSVGVLKMKKLLIEKKLTITV